MKNISEHCIKIGEVEGKDLIELSVSKIKKWRGCQQAFEYKYTDKLRPKKKAIPLRRGTWVHECLQSRAQGEDWVARIKQLKKDEYDKLFEEEKVELGDLPTEVFRIMRSYHQTWLKVDAEYEVIRAEQDFMIRIESTPFVLVGRIDLLVRHRTSGKIWIFEHKTMKRDIPTEDYRTTDVQTAVYSWVAEAIAPYLGYKAEDIGGVVMDYIKTKPPTIPDVLKNGELGRRANLDCDRYTYLACLKREGLDPKPYEEYLKILDTKKFFVRIPITKDPGMVGLVMQEIINTGRQIKALSGKCTARNLNFTCDRPKCEYRDLCLADLQGLDTSLLIKLNYERDEEDGKGKEDEPDD